MPKVNALDLAILTMGAALVAGDDVTVILTIQALESVGIGPDEARTRAREIVAKLQELTIVIADAEMEDQRNRDRLN